MGYPHTCSDSHAVEGISLVNKTLIMIIGVALVSVVIAMLYRNANNADLPDDEWFEFENLPT
jgi:hypothetical protein